MDESDLKTESFSNAQGWTMVRVTHVPSSLTVERSRSDDLRSAVSAQRECIDEIKGRLAEGEVPDETRPEFVARAEFDQLIARVEDLERRLSRATSEVHPEAGEPA